MGHLHQEEVRELIAKLEEAGVNRTQAGIVVEAAGERAYDAFLAVQAAKKRIASSYNGSVEMKLSCGLVRRHLLVVLSGVAYTYGGNGKGLRDYRKVLANCGITLPQQISSQNFAGFVAAMIQVLDGEPCAIRSLLSRR